MVTLSLNNLITWRSVEICIHPSEWSYPPADLTFLWTLIPQISDNSCTPFPTG
jgi:hypothetical protein